MARTWRTFALAHVVSPRRVALWCRVESDAVDGVVLFEVLNGGWLGTFFEEEGFVRIKQTGDEVPMVRVWEGEVPRYVATDWIHYNEAIDWIEEGL
jgi:hypothetical protein